MGNNDQDGLEESSPIEPPETGGLLGNRKINRREFVLGGAGVTLALIGSTAILSGCSSSSDSSTGDGSSEIVPEELSVDESQVVNSSDFTEVSSDTCVTESGTVDLPMGSIGYMDCDDIAMILSPGSANDVIVSMGLLSLSSATLTTVLAQAVSKSENYQIYDGRCNDEIIVWVESNLYTDAWRVYIATVVSSAEIGTPILVDEGDADFDPPMLTVSGKKAYWTVMPTEGGSASSSDSYLKSASVAASTPVVEYTSTGRMITNPQATDGIVTIVPRVKGSSSRYQMTAIDASTGNMVAAQKLPSSMKVNNAIYLDGDFVFGIEQTYNYGGGIANFGTYADIGDGQYLRFSRTPLDTPVKCGKYLVIKSTKNVIGLDTAAKTYFSIATPAGCESYGDFLMSTGTSERIVVYTSVPSGDGSGNGVVHLRAFSTIDG